MKSKQTKETFRAIGRRKAAVARVIIQKGTGKISVNGRKYEEYFPNDTIRMKINLAFAVLENENVWDVRANLDGGGITGQAEALRLGIARALVLFNEDNRKPLRAGGMLTRDSRVVQRKLYGRAKARKRYQFSKR